ncbi:MAG: hypothetical protein QW794_05035 [Thermosphaera sp.]|nr:hypothetical protein [Candidatus Nezhaarchaeota archaeon]
MSESGIGQDEVAWGLIAWIVPLVGAILALVLKPGYRYARYWAYLNLSFFIVIVIGGIIASILALIPFIGWLIGILIWVALLILWVVGIVKSVSKVYWKPPIVYDLARALGIERA